GSQFWILLPISTENKPDHCEIDLSGAKDKLSRLDGLQVVVVEDNEDTRAVLREVLTVAGAEVAIMKSVPEAREYLKESEPDIILTDIAMPGVSGLEMIEQLKSEQGNLSNIPIMVLSACAFDSDKKAALEAGASVFIAKPFRPAEVVDTVRELTLSRAMAEAE
ncbi:MAG: response regulator, partial [Bdellovibrionales bacterium]|nr:response regulator [Bdellovibrionales bacterium]